MNGNTSILALVLTVIALSIKAWGSRELSLMRGEIIEERSHRKAAEERYDEARNEIDQLRRQLRKQQRDHDLQSQPEKESETA